MSFSTIIDLVKETFSEWLEDKASRLAAAIAYYTAFSMAPLIIISLVILGLFFQSDVAEGYLIEQITSLIGADGADLFQQVMENASQPAASTVAAVIGIATLIFGASGVFGQLQDALNTVWDVAPKPGRGLWGMIESRFLSFTMVLGLGFLLLVSLVFSSILAAAGNFLSGYFDQYLILGQILNFVISFGFITLLFAMIFKILPDAKIDWGDVWIGALVTAFLFTLGKFLIGFYLGQQSFSSTYGAAGSVLIVLLWIYYSAQILLLGAEFTQVYARRFGSRIVPDEDAVALDEQTRAKQGIPTTQQLEEAQPGSKTRPTQEPPPASGPPLRPARQPLTSTEKSYTPSSIFLLIFLVLGTFLGAIRNKGH